MSGPVRSTGQMVVIAGAGVSAIPPCGVPSWMHFNEAVLDALRTRVTDSFDLSDELHAAVDALEVSSVGVELFSQVIHDSFAGSSWFDLLGVLDGTTPGQCHESIAIAAAGGRVRAVVTTNFDTLFERAFHNLGVQVVVRTGVDDLTSDVEPGVCQLVKVHGSVADARSLVDLSSQKAVGLSGNVRGWLARTFADRHVVVAGFSGADLGLAPDYLGLQEAGPHLRSLRWVTRPGRDPHPEASKLVASIPAAHFVFGSLPDVLADVDLPVPAPRDEVPRPPFAESVAAWFAQTHCSPELCLAACARMLLHVGHHVLALELGKLVIARMRDRDRDGLQPIEEYSYAVTLSHLGSQLIGRDDSAAIRVLRESVRRQADIVATWDPGSDAVVTEHRSNYTGALLNLGAALAHSGPGHLDEARAVAGSVRESLDGTSELPDRWAGLRVLYAAIAHTGGDLRGAILHWRAASRIAAVTGNSNLELMAVENRARTAAAIGEVELAAVLFTHADRLATRSVNALPRTSGVGDGLVRFVTEPGPRVRDLLTRVRDEVRSGGERVDEVLFGCVAFEAQVSDAGVRAELANGIAAVLTECVPVDPLAGALIVLAVSTLDSGADPEFARVRLPAWLREHVDVPLRSLARGVMVHEELGGRCGELGDMWTGQGAGFLNEGAWSEAFTCFVAASGAYVLAGDLLGATRGFIYATHVLDASGRLDVSRSILEWLLFDAGPTTRRLVQLRLVKHLAHRARSGGDVDELAAQAGALIEEVSSVRDEELGAAFVAYADLLYVAGDRSASRGVAEDAATLLTDPAHMAHAHGIAERAAGPEVS